MRRIHTKMSYKKIIMLSSILVVITFMSIGYALLTKELEITGTANLLASQEHLWYKLTNDNTFVSLIPSEVEENKYIFVGEDPENYITFNNELWRILSIENDNNIKIIRWNNTLQMEFDSSSNRTSQSTYCINPSLGCNAWEAKSVYTNGTITGSVENNSTLNTYLNTTFYNSILPESKALITQHTFNTGAIQLSDNVWGILDQELNNIWTGYVGIPTMMDLVNQDPGGNVGSTITPNYLSNYSGDNLIWTMTPLLYDTNKLFVIDSEAGQMIDANTTSFEENGITKNMIVLPVVYLKDTVRYVSGTGIISDPIIIK